MTKTGLLTAIFFILFAETAISQPKLGMIAQANCGLSYLSSAPGPGGYTGTRGNGYGYFGEVSGSVIGYFYTLIFPKSKFLVGDYLGVGLGLDYAKFESRTLQKYMCVVSGSYGGQAAYAITKDIDAGIRCFIDARLWIIGNNEGNVNTYPLMMGACARYRKFYFDVATGSGKNIEHNIVALKYSEFTGNIRYFLKKPGTGSYLGFRADKMHDQFQPAGSRTDNFTTFTLSFGKYFEY